MIAKDARRDQKGEFLSVVKGTLRKLADQGINKKSLLAGLNYYEFKYREADYGNAPKGLMFGPVSYTHLDVYKRQEQQGWALLQKKCTRIMRRKSAA